MVAAVVVTFVVLVALSTPIVFALGLSGVVGLVLGNFSLQKLPSALVAGSQSWVLLAVPTFVFAGSLMERCGMSYALVNLARALVGWVRGGLGMSVVLAEYFFSGISGSTIADVSAIGSMLTPPMLRAGYRPEHAVSLVASATAMGILVPPAIFMIVLGQIMDTSVVAIFLAGFIPAAVTAACLMIVIFVQAHRLGWPKDQRPTWAELAQAVRASLVPMVVPVLIVLGFFFGVFTATEAGALVAAYAMAAAVFYYRNVTLREMVEAPPRDGPPHGGGDLPPRRGQHLPVPDGHAGRARPARRDAEAARGHPLALSPGRGHPGHALRHGAGGASGGGGAHPRGVPRSPSRSASTPSTSPSCSPPPWGSASSCPPSAWACSWPSALPTSRWASTSGPTGPTCSRCWSGLLILILFPEITLFLPRRAGLVR